MPELYCLPPSAPRRRPTSSLARHETEVLEAQRLRYRIFAEEMGADIPSGRKGIDHDIYDKYCDHLLLRENDDNRVIGACRLLPPHQAKKIGGYHAQSQFELTRLLHLHAHMAEISRACLHRDHRNGTTASTLWDGIVQYMQQNRYEYLLGSVSISIADGGHVAASLYRKLHRVYGAPIEYAVFPRHPLPLETLNPYLDTPVPPILKGYLRLGAWICGEPTWDPSYNTADILLLLPMSRMRP